MASQVRVSDEKCDHGHRGDNQAPQHPSSHQPPDQREVPLPPAARPQPCGLVRVMGIFLPTALLASVGLRNSLQVKQPGSCAAPHGLGVHTPELAGLPGCPECSPPGRSFLGSFRGAPVLAAVTPEAPFLSSLHRYPWGQEAFDKAKKENKLIFLSGNQKEDIVHVPTWWSVDDQISGAGVWAAT